MIIVTTLLATKSVTRKLLIMHHGDTLMARMSPEGIYMKREGGRWSKALFLPWASVFDYAAIRAANEAKRLKKAKKEARKAGRL